MADVDYVTTAEVKAQLEITTTSTDALIQALITAASLSLNQRLKRELTPQTEDATRTFRVDGRYVDLAPSDLRSATTVTLEPQTGGSPTVLTAGTGYALRPPGGADQASTYTALKIAASVSLQSAFWQEFGYTELSILGDWGAWNTASVPADVKRAAIVTVASWMDRATRDYADLAEDPRAIRPARYATWAIPNAAWSAVAHLERITAI